MSTPEEPVVEAVAETEVVEAVAVAETEVVEAEVVEAVAVAETEVVEAVAVAETEVVEAVEAVAETENESDEIQPVTEEDREIVVESINSELSVDPDSLVEVGETLYLELKSSVTGLGINPANFIVIVTKVVEKIEKIKSLSGDESLTLSMEVLGKLTNEIPNVTESDRKYLNTTIPGMISTIISHSRGGKKFKTSKKVLKRAKREGLDKINISQVADDILHKLTVIIKTKTYSASYICSNLVVLSSMTMTMVEKYPTLSGMEKKNVVLRTLNRLVDDLPTLYPSIDTEQIEMVKQSLRALPDIIDTVIAVGNNKFEINQANIIKVGGMLVSFLRPCVKKCNK